MDKDQILKMDPNILYSVINTKLRDYFSSLDAFCDDVEIDIELVENKLKTAGYVYNKSKNQFTYL